MPRERRLEAYPNEFWTLFQVGTNREVCVELTRAKAKSLRYELYSFRAAMRRKLAQHPELFTKVQKDTIAGMDSVQLALGERGLLARPVNYSYSKINEAVED